MRKSAGKVGIMTRFLPFGKGRKASPPDPVCSPGVTDTALCRMAVRATNESNAKLDEATGELRTALDAAIRAISGEAAKCRK